MRGFVIAVCLLVFAACSVAVAAGLDVLTLEVAQDLALGTLVASEGLFALGWVPLLLSQPGTLLRVLAILGLCGALAWLPLSILLAGNLRLEFQGTSGQTWMALTFGLLAWLILTSLWGAIAAMRSRGNDRFYRISVPE